MTKLVDLASGECSRSLHLAKERAADLTQELSARPEVGAERATKCREIALQISEARVDPECTHVRSRDEWLRDGGERPRPDEARRKEELVRDREVIAGNVDH